MEIVYSCKTEKVGWGEGDSLQLKKMEKVGGVLTPFIFEKRLKSLFLKTST